MLPALSPGRVTLALGISPSHCTMKPQALLELLEEGRGAEVSQVVLAVRKQQLIQSSPRNKVPFQSYPAELLHAPGPGQVFESCCVKCCQKQCKSALRKTMVICLQVFPVILSGSVCCANLAKGNSCPRELHSAGTLLKTVGGPHCC